MNPIIPTVWSISCVAALAVLTSTVALGIFSTVLMIVLCAIQRSMKPVLTAIKYALPFALPLLVIHGVLNPAFPVDRLVFGQIPLRLHGVVYATLVSLRILLLTIAAIAWRYVDADKLLLYSVKIRIPINLITIIAVATSTVRMISLRVGAVYLAQQARGIAAGPGIAARFRALPAIILPVIISTLVEGSHRGDLMKNRGLGLTGIVFTETGERCRTWEHMLAWFALVLLLALRWFR